MYFLYGKFDDMKCFKPIDLTSQTFTNRLVYASFYYDNEKEKAESVAKDIMARNKGLKVVVRKH